MKKMATLVLASVLAFSTMVPASAASFPDVPEANFAYNEINYLVSLGAISGMPDGTYAPSMPVTRAEASKVISEALQLEADASYQLNVGDLPTTHWGYTSMKNLSYNQILFGDTRGMRPNDPISRAELAAMLNRAFDFAPPTKFWEFADLNASHWAYHDINQMLANGLTTESGTFRPAANVTRAEFAVFTARALDDQFKK
ncbi:S-layer homology domain-containing protein [Paenalkalicoccus suaedae]|uniref:S-layer homology domain-containing protein n=1 Tax=Paenalkalicoccus suaedae TaxID=2592382 RepID=A0A859FH55_9BACI|nr:S-layer homology domain-containing protein [Paenalkalicoccus suaedae]QKS72391.1 S-layer homology domain-containing protein [Paenalkalicoccus suaedae]